MKLGWSSGSRCSLPAPADSSPSPHSRHSSMANIGLYLPPLKSKGLEIADTKSNNEINSSETENRAGDPCASWTFP